MSCPACGVELRPDAHFCDECGRAVQLGRYLPEPAAFTPAHIAEKLRASRRAVEGERKQVTVLFADVTGSMELAAAVDPEDWRAIIDRFFSILCDGVHRFEGTVDKFTGDGIMALFGAPIAHEDHARRAGYAALHLAERLAAYAVELKREHGLNFSVRMGMNSGEVVVGTIGDDLRLDYTAIGQTVGLAQRMEALAEPGKAYLTEHTAALIEGYFTLRDLGRFDIKGEAKPVGVFALEGMGALRTRLDVSRTRGFSRFVGRDDEITVLTAAFDRAVEGNAEVVGVVADPGVGKSRLCYEFAERCRANGIEVYEAHCLAHTSTVAFTAVLEFLRGYFGIAEQDPDRIAREKIAGRLLLLDEAFKAALPLIFDFLGVPDPARPVPAMDPEARQRRLFGALNHLLRARSAEAPGVLMLEDLHWLDPASEAFLANLIETVPGTRTLVLVNFRPEYHAQWMQKSYYRQLPLLPLGPEAAGAILADLLGNDASLDGLTEMILERTGGNPFFLEEVAIDLAENGSVEGERGARRLVNTVEQVSIPATVQSVLTARIDRLGEREKGVLQTAAVVGREVSEPVLRRVAGLAEPALAAALHALVAAEFLHETALYPEAEYVFKHPLTEEVAYHSQLGARRARTHGAVAEAIVDLYPDRIDERAALLALHWEAAGDRLEAARWSMRAADWANYNDLGETVRHLHAAQTLTDALDPSEEVVEIGVTARAMTLDLLQRLGARGESGSQAFEAEGAKLYAEGRELAAGTADERFLARLCASYAAFRGLTGDLDAFVDLGLEAIEIADRTEDRALRMVMRGTPSYALWSRGRPRDGLRVCDEALAIADGDTHLGTGLFVQCPYAWLLQQRGFIQGCLGDLRAGNAHLERALELARERGDIESQCWSHLCLAWLAEYAGDDSPGGLAHARQAVEFAGRSGSAFSHVQSRSGLAFVLLMHGEPDEAAVVCEEGLEEIRQRRIPLEGEPWILMSLARARLARGNAAEAADIAERAVEISIERHTALAEVVARVTRALVFRHDAARALADLNRALTLCDETGFAAYEPRVRLGLAELARLRQDDGTAALELRVADEQFTDMGADKRAVDARAALAELVPTAPGT